MITPKEQNRDDRAPQPAVDVEDAMYSRLLRQPWWNPELDPQVRYELLIERPFGDIQEYYAAHPEEFKALNPSQRNMLRNMVDKELNPRNRAVACYGTEALTRLAKVAYKKHLQQARRAGITAKSSYTEFVSQLMWNALEREWGAGIELDADPMAPAGS